MAIFANILYDEAFKVILTNPSNRELLIKLVEFFLPGKTIKTISLDDKEQHGLLLSSKNSTFDLFCTTDQDERLIIEMQFDSQASFRDRMLYYASFPIQIQMMERMQELQRRVERGEPVTSAKRMDYSLSPVYVISIVNFKLPHESEDALEEGLLSRYDIRNDRNGELMTDALHFVFLELGRLKWNEGEQERCSSLLEQLAFSFRYGYLLEARPDSFEDELLRLLFKAMAFANMTAEQLTKVESIMRTELDIIAQRNWAVEEGRAEGVALGIEQLSGQLRALGVEESVIQAAVKAVQEQNPTKE